MPAVNRTYEVRMSFNTIADAEAGNTGTDLFINVGASVYEYDAVGTDLTTGDARTWTLATAGGGAGDLLAANNLSDVASADTARTNLGAASITAINTVTASRSLALTDASDILAVDTSLGAVVLTIDPVATTAYPVGTIIGALISDATNSLTITGGTGVTVNSVSAGSGIVTNSVNSEVSLLHRASNVWSVVGDIGAFA